MIIGDRFEGCIIGGAIGDAFGSAFEGLQKVDDSDTCYPFGKLTFLQCKNISKTQDCSTQKK